MYVFVYWYFTIFGPYANQIIISIQERHKIIIITTTVPLKSWSGGIAHSLQKGEHLGS